MCACAKILEHYLDQIDVTKLINITVDVYYYYGGDTENNIKTFIYTQDNISDNGITFN